MIISASYKTDIPAFYGEWFMRRLRAGWCRTVNPYGRQVYTVNLRREADDEGREGVDGIVFWTKNVGPFMPHLAEVDERGYPFVVQHSINGYPRALESRVVDASRAVGSVREIAEGYGSRAVVWRYDPIVFTSLTPLEWHMATFTRLAEQLHGAVREVVVSVAQLYQKTQRNMDAAAAAEGFDWTMHEQQSEQEGRELIRELAKIARGHGIALKVCAQERFLIPGLVEEAHCIDAAWFGGAYKRHGNRTECACSASRDIGEYDTCPHGCVYCYAVQHREKALARYHRHNPDSEFLFEPDFPTIQVAPRAPRTKKAPASIENAAPGRRQATSGGTRRKRVRAEASASQPPLLLP
ncbi:MAG TPA: DUF1848 domain-containing protein [Ktedonobacterales bacterium]|nr:DUF1848 domain-containing protein [Ktedonobacterales bacterium]